MNRLHHANPRWSTLVAPALFLATAAACGDNAGTTGPGLYDGGTDGGHPDGTTRRGAETGSIHGGPTPDSNAPEACASTMNVAHQSPLDMFLLLDRSGSMAYNDSWTQETQALESFFYDFSSRQIGVALQYMPLVDLCDPAAYAVPAVPIATLPGASGPLITSLGASRPFGGTPTTVALEGVLQAATVRQQAEPTHKVVIVLSTDGTPDTSCATVPEGGLVNGTDTSITILKQAAAAGIPTFVIGVGNQPTLDQFAAAGGTNDGKAILVGAGDAGTSVDIEAELITAFSAIRDQALPCEIKIPAATAGTINYADVNVTFTSSADASSEQFYGVGSASECKAHGPTWYYDNPSAPTNIVFCPEACSVARASLSGSVNVEFGCTPTMPPPPSLK